MNPGRHQNGRGPQENDRLAELLFRGLGASGGFVQRFQHKRVFGETASYG